MSQYNKTVLTHAGLELAKRANAGQAKFGITRAVTSADDWSNKTVQDLEEVTTIPNIMQQGTIMDTDEVESNNSVIGVSLCFTNKNLSTGYQIRIIGLYVKEEGQENDFLYAVTTAIAPEYMPSFADKVLYRFNTQMYLVIGNVQSVNVVINEGTAVTHGQFDKYKAEVTGNLKKLENTHKEDMSHVAKSASINGGAEILPDSTGKLNLVVPDPDLSRYVSLEQLTEILQAKADVTDVDSKIKTVTDLANTKANSADVYTKTETDNQINKFDLSKVKFRKQYLNGDGQTADKTWSATKNDDGTYTIDLHNEDWTAAKLHDVLAQLPNKANASDVYTKADIPLAFKGTLTSTDDMNKVFESGMYITQGAAPQNFPPSDTNHGFWGTILVYNHDAGQILQLWFIQGNVFHRWISTSEPQTEWQRYADQSDITDLQNKLTQYTVDYNNNYVHDTTIDFNSYLHETRTIKVANVKANNGPLANTAALWGWLTTYHWDDNSVTQEYRDAGGEVFWRATSASASRPWTWHKYATDNDITNLQNQIQQLRDNQFEVQTFTDATAAANWEAQRPGHRLAIVNS